MTAAQRLLAAWRLLVAWRLMGPPSRRLPNWFSLAVFQVVLNAHPATFGAHSVPVGGGVLLVLSSFGRPTWPGLRPSSAFASRSLPQPAKWKDSHRFGPWEENFVPD